MNAITIHDKAIISSRAENLLALRWARLAEKEGHKPSLPEMGRREEANARAAEARHKHVLVRNDAEKRKADDRILKHMAEQISVAELAEKTGITKAQVRVRLNRLKEEGRAVDFGGDGAFGKKVWQAVPGAKHVQKEKNHVNTRKMEQTRDIVLGFLAKQPGTSRDIASASGITSEAARKSLQRLALNGKVEEIGEVKCGSGKAKMWRLA
jgi:predicted HTH transcriptional regulator